MDARGAGDDWDFMARPAECVDDDHNDAIPSLVLGKAMSTPSSPQTTVAALDDNVFLHASMQLVQQQSETRQRVRNLWYLIQRLRWDGHLDTTAMDILRNDLLQVIKGLSMEKQDGTRSGELVHHMSSSGCRQKVWAVLHHDHGRLDLTTVPDTPPSSSSQPSDPFGLSKLSASLAWILDGGNGDAASGAPSQATKSVSVLGATVRSVVTSSSSQLVEIAVPPSAGSPASLVFLEAPSEAMHLEWIDALTSVARSDLLAMQVAVGGAASADMYKAAVAAWSPIRVPLTWQRGVVEKQEKQAGLNRRDSKNLSMLQVFKDIARDKYVVDGVPVATSDDVVRALMAKVLPFLLQLELPLSPSVQRSSSSSPVARLTRSSEATALSFVERVLRGSARTQSGGDIYDAIALVCANPALVTLCPVSHDVLPVTLTVDTVAHPLQQLHVHMQVCMQFKAMPHFHCVTSPVTSPRAALSSSTPVSPRELLTSPRAEPGGDCAVLTGTLTRTFTFGAAADPGHVAIVTVSA
ncbi:hypothetical protein B5M09_012856 [Aphanomyces astaci]|uniref:PH domain-containing protein n=1 Tax=Aphanomyces astaci TaxID=112090 RepID=A0A3R7YXJ9_APHAT|nr:hypothetical protein B5M09_012856 [Aphanomyces astaci]